MWAGRKEGRKEGRRGRKGGIGSEGPEVERGIGPGYGNFIPVYIAVCLCALVYVCIYVCLSVCVCAFPCLDFSPNAAQHSVPEEKKNNLKGR